MKIVANWKMNLDFKQSLGLANKYLNLIIPNSYELIVLGSDLVLEDLVIKFKDSKIKIYAQDCSKFSESGSYTGEISAKQLKKLGCHGVMLGHIERRKLLNESDKIINIKVQNALESDLKVILNIGEIEHDLNFTESIKLFKKQIDTCLKDVNSDEVNNKLIIAYESVDTISSLKSNKDKEDNIDLIIEKITFIKDYLNTIYPKYIIPVLFGGSLDNDDITSLKKSKIVDGFLIGRKSLDFKKFNNIISHLIYT